MEHLAARGINCPLPVRNRLAARSAASPAALRRWSLFSPACGCDGAAEHCAAVGKALAELHLAGEGFSLTRRNALSIGGWRPLFEMCDGRADKVVPGLGGEIARELDHLEAGWPRDLPQGVIHADLFPDTSSSQQCLSGLIDFYFACDDMLAYDVAVCINACASSRMSR